MARAAGSRPNSVWVGGACTTDTRRTGESHGRRRRLQTRATYGGLCGMPACGQAAGCGVCDTPELWCGAVGLYARVRACAGAAESIHTYIHATGSTSFSST